MSRANAETPLSYHCLTGPLVSNPATELDRAVNKLQTKYRSYIVEYDVEDGAVRLPSLFGADFGDQVTRLATLIDAKENQFEVLVERINGAFFLSKGWKALRDFYGIRLGAWITLVYVGLGKFAIFLKDRFQKVMRCPVFYPPMHFVIDKTNVQPTFQNHMAPFTANLSFRHDNSNFTLELPKKLSEHDVSKGFLMLRYGNFVEQALDKARTNLKLVDECGNLWECVLIFGTTPHEHCLIGGGWKRFVDARNLANGVRIRLGAPKAGENDTIYVRVYDD